MMHDMFATKSTVTAPAPLSPVTDTPEPVTVSRANYSINYLSDWSDDENDIDEDGNGADTEDLPRQAFPPPLKRRKLDVPYRVQHAKKHAVHISQFTAALKDIDKLIQSKKTKFISGPQGLQARRALVIRSHLQLVVKNKRFSIDASLRAAESHGFAAKWGGRNLRSWTRNWTRNCVLPLSLRGQHAKVYTLLSDPVIAAELRAYVRSNKWAMNPDKLRQFSKNELLPDTANKYLRHLVREEMPLGLKKYMEVELFPRVYLRVGRGISLSTARRWLRLEGFRFISHKKGLYFDGHDRPDVLSYRQNEFLPTMKRNKPRLVRYTIGNVETELAIQPQNYVERRLVLCAHDEMTAQAHDTNEKSWVLEDQHALRKKGVGHGLHKSDVICSTFGWLKDASQTLEYGKNYEGYWTGELFVKQVTFILAIPCLQCHSLT